MPKVPPEVIAEQYELKATFFSNRLEKSEFIGLFEFAIDALSLIGKTLNWEARNDFGISNETFAQITETGRDPAMYFCHPNVISATPKLLTYFRCISTFSQKGLKSVSGVSSVDKIENEGRLCTPDQSMKLAKALNANLSAIFSVSLPSDEKLKGIMYATAGTTIDGSWRNAIGVEGERIIRTLFLKEILKFKQLVQVCQKGGIIVEASNLTYDWLDLHMSEIQSASFVNGSTAIFASEPDITLLNGNGEITAGVEIKAGIDPAGALERLGAMMKSFEKILLGAPNADTVLVATCITDEVASRLSTMGRSRTFILTDIIHNRKNRGTELMTILRRKLGLVDVTATG
jgi:hypothetical protein